MEDVLGPVVSLTSLTLSRRGYLWYDEGGHFRTHKDTEKEEGMFGTLVVQLPTSMGYEGGKLVVRHQGQRKEFAWEDASGTYSVRRNTPIWAARDDLRVRSAAFYGDCEHELEPVRHGVRLCLLYNLVRTTRGPAPVAAQGQAGSQARLRLDAAAKAWKACQEMYRRPDSREFVIIPLEHEYTHKSMLFAGLKGRDWAMTKVLRSCPDIDIHLAALSKHENGEPNNDHWGDYGGWGGGGSGLDEERTMGEIFETKYSFEKWIAVDDKPIRLPVSGFCPTDILNCEQVASDHPSLVSDEEPELDEEEADEMLFPDGLKPDKRRYQGYTGNECPTLDFWYLKVVIVLWPSSRTFKLALRHDSHGVVRTVEQHAFRHGPEANLPLSELSRTISLAEDVRNHHVQDKRCKFFSVMQGLDSLTDELAGHEFVALPENAVGILRLCIGAGAPGIPLAHRLLRLLSEKFSSVGVPGMNSKEMADALVELVQKAGWPPVGAQVTKLLEASGMKNAAHVAALAERLSSTAIPVPRASASANPSPAADAQGAHAPQMPALSVRVKREETATEQPRQAAPSPSKQGGEQSGTAVSGNLSLTDAGAQAQSPSGASAKAIGKARSCLPSDGTKVSDIDVVGEGAPAGHGTSLIAIKPEMGILSEGHGAASDNVLRARTVEPSESIGHLLAVKFAEAGLKGFSGTELTSESLSGLLRMFFGLKCYTQAGLLTMANLPKISTKALGDGVHACKVWLSTHQENAIQGSPPLMLTVELAARVMDRPFGDLEASNVKTLAEDILWILKRDKSAESLIQRFTHTVLTLPNQGGKRQSILQALVESFMVKQAARSDGSRRLLALCRLEYLEDPRSTLFTWRQPQAVVPGHPAVERFLRSDEPTMTYAAFNDIRHARNFAKKHFVGVYHPFEHHSATATLGGHGAKAYVTIVKIGNTEDARRSARVSFARQARNLREHLGMPSASASASADATAGSSTASGGGGSSAGGLSSMSSPNKRPRRESEEVIDLSALDP